MARSTKKLLALPFLTLAIALVHCSAPESADEAPTTSQDLVSARDAFCKDFQGETPRAFCHVEAPAPGGNCAPGCIWSQQCTSASPGSAIVCTKKGQACTAANLCQPDASAQKSELVECLPRGERGDGNDLPPHAGTAALRCHDGCSNANGAHCLSPQEAEDETFCRGKTGDIFPVTFCKPGGEVGKANRLIECHPGSQRGAFGDPGDWTSSISCLNGCTNAGLAHCLSETEVEETKFCVGKVGDLFPTLNCMKTPGSADKLVECIPGSLRGEPTDPGDSARSVRCLSGCSQTSPGVAACNGTPP
jgi:hypothetical protein